MDAIRLEMANVGVAFKILEPRENPPPGYTKSSGHMVYDEKMDFTRKGRWVKDGNRPPNPETAKYALLCMVYQDLQLTFVTRSSKLQRQRNTSLCVDLNLE